jgi:sigma-B regulation protein RsbU (phosphoserine phosphatase)
MTGWGTIDTAVEAMRRGARSFVQKPWDDTTLVDIVGREIADGRAARRRDARLAREQDEARLIQRALLPATLPTLPAARSPRSGRRRPGIGGDCYDVLRFSDTRVAVSIADVAGKGLPAALLMSNLQAALRAFAGAAADPHDVCTSVNRLLCRNIAPGRFVTFCYAVIDTDAGTISYANAGHNPPLIARAGGVVDRLEPTGLVLGVADDWKYSTRTVPLGAGDRVVWFTDGVTEAVSPEGEEFGEDRLVALVRRRVAAPPDTMLNEVGQAVHTWTAGAGPQDDATLIVAAIG